MKCRFAYVDLIAGSLLLVATLAALLWPLIEYDSWSYHLPFSARLFGLGGDSYQMDRVMELRWMGFPVAWNWIQGVLWWATGELRATAVPQLILFLGYLVVVGRSLEISRSLLILGFFSSPLLILHQQGILTDLPAGLLLAVGFVILVRSIDLPGWREPVIGVLLLGLAGNIKVQALLAVVVVAVAIAILSMIERKAVARTLLLAVAACGLASISAAANYARFANPLFPFEVRAGSHVLFAGLENPMVDANPPRYDIGARSIVPPQPISFLLSATELDWTLRGVAPRYTTAMEGGNGPLKGGPSRTGGWGWLFVLGSLFLLAAQLIRRDWDPLQRRLVIGSIVAIGLTAVLPRSHELRYWLFIPLILVPVNVRFLARHMSHNALGWVLMGTAAYALIQVTFTPNAHVMLLRPPLPQADDVPPEMRRGVYCDPNRDSLLFRYSKAVTGEPVRLTMRCGSSR